MTIYELAFNSKMAHRSEEELAVCVQNFQVLYDKSHADFHRKDIKKNAWNSVAQQLGFEDGK